MIDIVLPDFQKFLAERELVPQNQIAFYAQWVSKFLAFSNNHEAVRIDLEIKRFLDYLSDKKNKGV